MNSIAEPFDEEEMQKLATIYRNRDLNLVYVCCVCEFSFTNIVDTLSHAESHLNVKVNITDEKNYEFVGVSEVVSETADGNPIKTEYVDDILEVVSETVDEKRVESEDAREKQLESKLEQNLNDHQEQNYEQQDEEMTSRELVVKCKLCNKTFDAVSLLIIHTINEHAGRPPFTCPQCFQIWDNKFTFFTHLQKHMDGNGIAYDVLTEKLISDCKEVVKSRTRKCPPTEYQPKSQKTCDICQATFPNIKEIYSHMRKKHIQKTTYECDKCNRKVAGKIEFYALHYGHLTDGDAVNALDENVLQEKLQKFLDDNIYHDDSAMDRKFGCKLCSHLTISTRKCAKLHILQRHIHYVRRNTYRKYPCPHCYQSFAYASTLNVHQQIHTQEKQFSCSICKKTFAQLRYLRSHEITHSDIKSHQCTTCGSTFKTLVRLNNHMKTHLDLNSKCTICGKEVKQYRLWQHIRNVHENMHRPYSCPHCSQKFKTTSTLKNHSYRHTGEKKFECRFHCKEKFISAAARRSHERAKHEPH